MAIREAHSAPGFTRLLLLSIAISRGDEMFIRQTQPIEYEDNKNHLSRNCIV